MNPAFLNNKKCLITGAASGIGRATAFAAAREGARLFLTDINAAELERVAGAIRFEGGVVEVAGALDIADFKAVQDFAAAIHAAHGSLDVLMNIAGIAVLGAVEHMEHRHWQRCVDINLMGPIHVIECFLPPMIAARRGGHLVNVSSAAGLLGLPGHAAYSASKFGVRGISEVLRFDLARHGIGVSLVCPGRVNTGLVHTVELVGVEMSAAETARQHEDFVKRAVPVDRVAAAILDGIRKRRYLVFTSNDVRIAHGLQRICAPIYELLMRRLNDRLSAVSSHGGKTGGKEQS